MNMNDMTSDYTLQTTPTVELPSASRGAESRFSPIITTCSKSGYKYLSVSPASNTIIPSNRASGTKRFSNPSNRLPTAQGNGIPSINEPRLQVEQVLKDHVPRHQGIRNSAPLRRPLYIEKRTLPSLKNKHLKTTRRVFWGRS